MHHVLAVGTDPALLYTRSMVLEKTGASVLTSAPEKALLLLSNHSFDLLVICHSTCEHHTYQLCLAARAHTPAIKILLIKSPTGNYHLPADVNNRFLLEDGPALLITTVQHLLAAPEPGELTPAARLVPFVRSRRPGSHKPPALGNVAQPQPAKLRASASGEARN